MNNKHILLHLSLIDGISSATIAQILVNKPEAVDLTDIYSMSEHDLMVHFDLPHAKAQSIKSGLADTALLATELGLIDRHSIQWATILCAQYPGILKTIHLPPPIIYWRGAMLESHEKSIAFVGSRDANVYGQHVIDQLVPPLVERGYAIISGGAKGADSMAHKTALEHEGKTIAVLGAGLLMPYLTSVRDLFQAILANNGALMSAFPLRMQASTATFPARNRIISGLSRGSVVVQAAQKSGALITARYALEQGRDVFAVPGAIHDPLSAGCHGLIAQGATLVAHVDDILKEFGEYEEPAPEAKKNKAKMAADLGQMPLSAFSVPMSQMDCVSKGDLDTSPAGIIIRACARACSMDDLVEKTGFDAITVQGILFELQLEGRLKQNFMGMWEKA